ncbi:MAG: V-type ATP synthase subunit E [Oscillospiraceae bacterium]|nr:V-type ATP synthase subunit E [Oscillospiraceae bacterium]
MSGIENIIGKITEDAKTKAAQMIAQATHKANLEAETAAKSAKGEAARVLEQAGVLASRRKEQILAKTRAETRDKKLGAKQKAIDKVFAESLERLKNLPQGEFERFVSGACKIAGIREGDQIILPEKYKKTDIKKIDPRLSLYAGERAAESGFILISGGFEQNNTFSALLDFIRNDIEPEVISLLF